MVGTITKTIKGKKYTYFEYFEDGKTVQKYCGALGSDRARKVALQYEYEIVKEKKDAMVRRLAEIREELRRI